jgi:uncharacterized protein (TIGR02646 family)
MHGRLPAGWEDRARRVLEEIRLLPPEERHAAINRHNDIWSELKALLAELSHGKCWYCEAKDIRSDNNVDHFRPKNQVLECPQHQGYWWLAFAWENYRFSCTFCNSKRRDRQSGTIGGKHDHFPLVKEENRAFNEGDDLTREDPLLLDPVRPADTVMLWFTEDGRAVERYSEQNNRLAYWRANKSIELYNLNHIDIVEARKALFAEIRRLVKEGDAHLSDLERGEHAATVGFNSVVEKMLDLMSATSIFSASAKSMVIGLKDINRPWLESLLASQ